MNIAQHIERAVHFVPNNPAILFEDQVYSYRSLNIAANRVANSLRNLDVERGDRVALLLPNIPEFIFAYLGIQKIGAIAVTLNTMLVADEVTFMLNDCTAKIIIATEQLSTNVPFTEVPSLLRMIIAEGKGETTLAKLMTRASSRARAVDMHPNDPAAIVYSSGTTGFPKGVTLSHGNVVSNIFSKNHYLNMQPDDRMQLFLPLFHCFGQNAVMNACFNAFGTLLLQRRFDPQTTLDLAARQRATMFFAVPTVFKRLLNTIPTNSLRCYFSAAAPLPIEVARAWYEKTGIHINIGYGLSESSPFATYNHPIHYKFGSVGTPIENVEVRIVDPDNEEEVSFGDPGEIVIRGPNVMLGYWNHPELTSKTIVDGWLHTGDIGTMDEKGYLYIVDRLKDMINVSGMKVFPAEAEKVILKHHAVKEVAVYGLDDQISGERVAATIVFNPGQSVSVDDIFAYCQTHMARYKIPKQLNIADALPRSPTGKVLKRELRQLS